MIEVVWKGPLRGVPTSTILALRTIGKGEKTRRLTSALIIASEGGELSVVKLLLSRGAKANLRDEDGNTALHTAIEEGHVDVVRILLPLTEEEVGDAVITARGSRN